MHLIDCYPGHISKILELNPKRVKNVFSINSDTFSSSCRTVVELRLTTLYELVPSLSRIFSPSVFVTPRGFSVSLSSKEWHHKRINNLSQEQLIFIMWYSDKYWTTFREKVQWNWEIHDQSKWNEFKMDWITKLT